MAETKHIRVDAAISKLIEDGYTIAISDAGNEWGNPVVTVRRESCDIDKYEVYSEDCADVSLSLSFIYEEIYGQAAAAVFNEEKEG